jgi:5-formyltetrahydrofolate cyclo-ligase
LSHSEDLVRRKAELRRLLLVPLLGFDRHGHRLGHGKCYHDPTLRALREGGAAPLAIGLAFALMEVGEVPVAPADQPLDAVVTDRASHRCSLPPELATVQAGRA